MRNRKTVLHNLLISLLLLKSISFQPVPVYADEVEKPDIIYMTFNKSFYVTGETIWYKINFLQKNPDTGVLHVGLFDSQGNFLTDQKLKVNGNSVSGSFPIPIEWPDDNYRFVLTTRWNLNFADKGIYEHIIPVYNSSLPRNYVSTDFGITISQQTVDENTRPTPELHVMFSKIYYMPGDSVQLTIEPVSSAHQYNLSVSVTDLSQVPYGFDNIATSNSNSVLFTRNYQPVESVVFKPEKKLQLEGIVQKPDRSENVNSNVLSVRMVSQNKFIRAGTEKGRFIAELPDFNREDIIQVLDMNPYQDPTPFIKPVSIWDHISINDSLHGSPVHTPEIDAYIYHTRLRRKINEIFNNPDTYVRRDEPSAYNLPPPDLHYDMSKFKNLTDLLDFVKNVMLSINRMPEKGNTSLRLYNDQTHFYFMHRPWYLVDGLFTNNEADILATPFSSIVSLDFYTNAASLNHFEPLMIMNGIVRVTTNDQHWEKNILASPNTFNFEGFYTGASFLQEQPELDPRNKQSPDFRPVVFWEPDVKIIPGKPANIIFKATDNPGLFLVVISGTNGNGVVVHASAVYKVRNR